MHLVEFAFRLLPTRTISRTLGRLSKIESKALVGMFARQVGADIREAEKPIGEYGSIASFFTRRLAVGSRPVLANSSPVISPADGVLFCRGDLNNGTLIPAKGRSYSVEEFIAESDARFMQGSFLGVYLAPGDYHRVHSPVTGKIVGYTHIPGRLFPVAPWALKNIRRLFSENERVVVRIETEELGHVLVVFVGATNVGSIRLSFESKLSTNSPRATKEVHRGRYKDPIQIVKGEELGMFEMGSTVIVLTEKNVEHLGELDARVHVGESIARLTE